MKKESERENNSYEGEKWQRISTYLITLNVNGLNAPIKKHRVLNGLENMTCIYAA